MEKITRSKTPDWLIEKWQSKYESTQKSNDFRWYRYNYDFDKYFDIKWETGELIPNSDASKKDQRRAEITIKLYNLNEYGKPNDRLEELEKFNNTDFDIDSFSYRFFLKVGKL